MRLQDAERLDELVADQLDAFDDHSVLIPVVPCALLGPSDGLLVGDTDID